MNGDTIIDITGIQFEFSVGFAEEVYVGKENSFYQRLEEKQIYKNYDITLNDQLWNDYLIIMSYMPKELF